MPIITDPEELKQAEALFKMPAPEETTLPGGLPSDKDPMYTQPDKTVGPMERLRLESEAQTGVETSGWGILGNLIGDIGFFGDTRKVAQKNALSSIIKGKAEGYAAPWGETFAGPDKTAVEVKPLGKATVDLSLNPTILEETIANSGLDLEAIKKGAEANLAFYKGRGQPMDYATALYDVASVAAEDEMAKRVHVSSRASRALPGEGKENKAGFGYSVIGGGVRNLPYMGQFALGSAFGAAGIALPLLASFDRRLQENMDSEYRIDPSTGGVKVKDEGMGFTEALKPSAVGAVGETAMEVVGGKAVSALFKLGGGGLLKATGGDKLVQKMPFIRALSKSFDDIAKVTQAQEYPVEVAEELLTNWWDGAFGTTKEYQMEGGLGDRFKLATKKFVNDLPEIALSMLFTTAGQTVLAAPMAASEMGKERNAERNAAAILKSIPGIDQEKVDLMLADRDARAVLEHIASLTPEQATQAAKRMSARSVQAAEEVKKTAEWMGALGDKGVQSRFVAPTPDQMIPQQDNTSVYVDPNANVRITKDSASGELEVMHLDTGRTAYVTGGIAEQERMERAVAIANAFDREAQGRDIANDKKREMLAKLLESKGVEGRYIIVGSEGDVLRNEGLSDKAKSSFDSAERAFQTPQAVVDEGHKDGPTTFFILDNIRMGEGAGALGKTMRTIVDVATHEPFHRARFANAETSKIFRDMFDKSAPDLRREVVRMGIELTDGKANVDETLKSLAASPTDTVPEADYKEKQLRRYFEEGVAYGVEGSVTPQATGFQKTMNKMRQFFRQDITKAETLRVMAEQAMGAAKGKVTLEYGTPIVTGVNSEDQAQEAKQDGLEIVVPPKQEPNAPVPGVQADNGAVTGETVAPPASPVGEEAEMAQMPKPTAEPQEAPLEEVVPTAEIAPPQQEKQAETPKTVSPAAEKAPSPQENAPAPQAPVEAQQAKEAALEEAADTASNVALAVSSILDEDSPWEERKAGVVYALEADTWEEYKRRMSTLNLGQAGAVAMNEEWAKTHDIPDQPVMGSFKIGEKVTHRDGRKGVIVSQRAEGNRLFYTVRWADGSATEHVESSFKENRDKTQKDLYATEFTVPHVAMLGKRKRGYSAPKAQAAEPVRSMPPEAPAQGEGKEEAKTPMQKAVAEAEGVIEGLDTFRATGRVSAENVELRQKLGKVAKKHGVKLDDLIKESMWQAVPPATDKELSTIERQQKPAKLAQVETFSTVDRDEVLSILKFEGDGMEGSELVQTLTDPTSSIQDISAAVHNHFAEFRDGFLTRYQVEALRGRAFTEDEWEQWTEAEASGIAVADELRDEGKKPLSTPSDSTAQAPGKAAVEDASPSVVAASKSVEAKYKPLEQYSKEDFVAINASRMFAGQQELVAVEQGGKLAGVGSRGSRVRVGYDPMGRPQMGWRVNPIPGSDLPWGSNEALDVEVRPAVLRDFIELALKARLPVNAEATDSYGIKPSANYVREGDMYVFKPQSTKVTAPKAGRAGASELTPSQKEALPLLKQTRGSIANLAGPGRSKLRQKLFEMWTGQKLPSAKTGINALRDAIYKSVPFPASADTIASKEEFFAKWVDEQISGGANGNDMAKPFELMALDEYREAKPSPRAENRHAELIIKAWMDKKPVLADSWDRYNKELPEGYVREGDMYVFKPKAEPVPPTGRKGRTPAQVARLRETAAKVREATAGGEGVLPKKETAKHTAVYNGKEVEADTFQQAAMRVSDNLRTGEHGYVRTPDGKLFEVSRDRKTAVPVKEMRTKKERDLAILKDRLAKAKYPGEREALGKRIAELTKQPISPAAPEPEAQSTQKLDKVPVVSGRQGASTPKIAKGAKVATTYDEGGISFVGEFVKDNGDGTSDLIAFGERKRNRILQRFPVDADGVQVVKRMTVPSGTVRMTEPMADVNRMTPAQREAFRLMQKAQDARMEQEIAAGASVNADELTRRAMAEERRQAAREGDTRFSMAQDEEAKRAKVNEIFGKVKSIVDANLPGDFRRPAGAPQTPIEQPQLLTKDELERISQILTGQSLPTPMSVNRQAQIQDAEADYDESEMRDLVTAIANDRRDWNVDDEDLHKMRLFYTKRQTAIASYKIQMDAAVKNGDMNRVTQLGDMTISAQYDMRQAVVALGKSGSKRGQALQALQTGMDKNYNVVYRVREFTKRVGRDITAAEYNEIEKQTEKDTAEQKKRYDELQQAITDEENKRMEGKLAKVRKEAKVKIEQAYRKGAEDERASFEFVLNEKDAKRSRRKDPTAGFDGIDIGGVAFRIEDGQKGGQSTYPGALRDLARKIFLAVQSEGGGSVVFTARMFKEGKAKGFSGEMIDNYVYDFLTRLGVADVTPAQKMPLKSTDATGKVRKFKNEGARRDFEVKEAVRDAVAEDLAKGGDIRADGDQIAKRAIEILNEDGSEYADYTVDQVYGVITGYPVAPEPDTRDGLEKRYAMIRKHMLAIQRITGMENKEYPETMGKKQDRPDPTLRGLARTVREMMNDFEFPPGVADTRMMNAQAALVSRLQYAIEELDKAVKTQTPFDEKAPKPVKETDEIRDLRNVLRGLRESYEAMPSVEAIREVRETEKARQAANKRYHFWLKRMEDAKLGVYPTSFKGNTQAEKDAATKEYRDKAEAARQEYWRIKKDSPQERLASLTEKVTKAEARLETLEAALAETPVADPSPKKTPFVPANAEEAAALAKLEETREAVARVRKAIAAKWRDENAEAIYRVKEAERFQYLSEKAAMIEKKIKNRDFTKAPKRQPVTSGRIVIAEEKVRQGNRTIEENMLWEANKAAGWTGIAKNWYNMSGNVYRAFKASYDSSNVGVQSMRLFLAHPLTGGRMLRESWVNAFSDENMAEFMAAMHADPQYEMAYADGLALDQQFDDVFGTGMGEAFFRRQMEKGKGAVPFSPRATIGVISKGVVISQRAFDMYGRAMRFEAYKAIVNNPAFTNLTPVERKAIANAVNIMGGVGNTKMFNHNVASVMGSLMWSSRLFTSQLQTVMGGGGLFWNAGLGPEASRANMKRKWYQPAAPGVGSLYAKSLAGNIILAQAFAALGMFLGDRQPWEDEETLFWKAFNFLFGRPTVGSKTFDFSGGLTTYVTLARKLVLDGSHVAMSGRNVSDEGFAGKVKVLSNFFRGRLRPDLGFALNVAFGEDVTGEKFGPRGGWEGIGNMVGEGAFPITPGAMVETTIDLHKTHGWTGLAFGLIPSLAGDMFGMAKSSAPRDPRYEIERHKSRVGQVNKALKAGRETGDYSEYKRLRGVYLFDMQVEKSVSSLDSAAKKAMKVAENAKYPEATRERARKDAEKLTATARDILLGRKE